MDEILYRYNPWWEESFKLPKTIRREKFLEKIRRKLDQKEITFLTGLRRVGKTTLLKLTIAGLIEKGIDPKDIFYVSLDDYSLKDQSLLELVEEFRRIHKIPFKKHVYLFFDEITYQKDFEQQLKNFYDSQDVKIFASSSSASLLKNGKPYLTGRSSVIEILPLDFNEYLKFKGIEIKNRDKHLRGEYFEDYLKVGGIPQFVIEGDIEYLKELVDDIIMKDIAAVHNLKNPQILKDLFLLLMERAGKQMSINKIANILGISPDTAKRYLEMFETTYLIYTVKRSGKTNEKILSAKKIYAADVGIKTLFTGFRDKGALFENYVYLQIKHLDPEYLYEQSLELDFLIGGKTLIEVKYGRDLEGRQKELFESLDVKDKILIKSLSDLTKLEGLKDA